MELSGQLHASVTLCFVGGETPCYPLNRRLDFWRGEKFVDPAKNCNTDHLANSLVILSALLLLPTFKFLCP
jgi:hypothetical protein